MDFAGREAPDGQLGAGQRGELGDVGDREAKAVVAIGADRDRDRDRDVEDGGDELQERRLVGLGFDVVEGGRAKQEVGVAFVVGVDGDQPDLGVGRAAS